MQNEQTVKPDAIGASVAAVSALYPPDPTERDQVLASMVIGIMVGYDARWRGAGWVTAAVEQEFVLPIINPETGRSSRTFRQAGKIDGIALWTDDRLYQIEHKSTTEDISDPAGPYFRRLAIESQVSQYVLAKWQQGVHLDGTLYDVIRRPGIRPKAISKADQKAIAETGIYCGFNIDPPADVTREDAYLYQCRVARECLEQPERYFARVSVPRLDTEVLEYAQELWEMADQIRLARVNHRHPRHPGSCMAYGRPCEYLGVCSGHDTFESDRWTHRDKTHAELSLPDGDLDTLTHSSIRTFQTCPRKYHYKYELGFERVDEDESEALQFGSLLHSALEAWWGAFKPNHTEEIANGNAIDGSAANEVAEPGASGDQQNMVAE